MVVGLSQEELFVNKSARFFVVCNKKGARMFDWWSKNVQLGRIHRYLLPHNALEFKFNCNTTVPG